MAEVIPRGLPDTPLLDRVQAATLRYFTDFAHPVSGMARERTGGADSYDAAETVTTGGTGMGVMAILAGAERGFLPKPEAEARIGRIVAFLEAAPRYRGAFAHWMNGTTGATVAFSANDDGGDIVETAFLIAGLLAARQYWPASTLAVRIDALWRGVDWAGYCPSPERLMWHWSPDHDSPGLAIRGWHEALIAFVLGLASPTHPIDPAAYHHGWKETPTYRNGRDYYGHRLPLGPALGGPLFFAHYSFLGLDPRGLSDDQVDFWEQGRAQTLINRAHCVANPLGHTGYGPDCWGLTACDGNRGYDAFSPTNDRGVIAPTAALSSMPYTPAESLAALRHFHDDLGAGLWGPYGFRDAFNPGADWVAETNLAIDQGPIVAMIENHRSGLLWRLFMSCPEVAPALARMGLRRRLA